ncbi:MAG: (2Fe-2S)-binding protein [Chloroflexi bacterium]|nr:(2Fe-2S)-binding protein [Chloroflexota bacterium]
MVQLTIDNRKLESHPGEKILWTALEAGIFIPHLCALKEVEAFAGCRLCLVEIEGEKEPAAACAREVAPGMVVRTDSDRLKALRRLSLELILASHQADCPACALHKKCQLQDLAARLKVSLKPRRFPPLYPAADEFEHRCIEYVPERCVICTRCTRACTAIAGKGIIDLRFRGLDTVIGSLAEPEDYEFCLTCGKCVEVCPAAALRFRSDPDVSASHRG